MFEALGRFIYQYRWFTLALSLAFLGAAVAMLVRGGELTSGVIHGLEASRAEGLVEEVIGHPSDTTWVAVFHSPDLDPRDEAFQTLMQEALKPLDSDPRVLSVLTRDNAPSFIAADLINGPAHAALALITLKGTFKEALQVYPSVRRGLHSGRLSVVCTGRLPFMSDLNRTLEDDLLRAELVSLPLALIVLLLVFRTAMAAVLPVAVGTLAVVGAVAVVLGLSRYTDIAQYTINVCSLVGLGVAIDYSLFTVSRYREELAAGQSYREALVRAMATAGRVVGFSGIAVSTGLAGLFFFEGSYLRAMGIGGVIVVALAVVFALTFLPALLAVLGPGIHLGRMPFGRLGPGEGFWHRLASWVMRRPATVLVPTAALLLLMGVPFLHLRMTAADVRVLTAAVEARQGYDRLLVDFPDQARTRVLVAVRFPTSPALNASRIGALYDLSRRIAKLPHVEKVQSIVDGDQPMEKEDYQTTLLEPPSLYANLIDEAKKLTVSHDVVLLYVLTEGAPESEKARGVVRAIREQRQVGDGTLWVGGQAAYDLDTTQYILERAPRAVGLVVGVTFVVLFLLLRSVVLPIKAVIMNFMSIAGAFGAIVWVFQDGHLLVGEPRPLEPSLPVILFCTLFGLSMDYEVLMLSRIKESYDLSHDNTHAVADGLEKTAGLITSAAAIMVAVFVSFATARVVIIKAVGFGMALAVALDATLVRVLLVPATMRLFGQLNWWAPRIFKKSDS